MLLNYPCVVCNKCPTVYFPHTSNRIKCLLSQHFKRILRQARGVTPGNNNFNTALPSVTDPMEASFDYFQFAFSGPYSQSLYLYPRPLLLGPRSFTARNVNLVRFLPPPGLYCKVWMNLSTPLDVTLTCQHHVLAASSTVIRLASEI